MVPGTKGPESTWQNTFYWSLGSCMVSWWGIWCWQLFTHRASIACPGKECIVVHRSRALWCGALQHGRQVLSNKHRQGSWYVQPSTFLIAQLLAYLGCSTTSHALQTSNMLKQLRPHLRLASRQKKPKITDNTDAPPTAVSEDHTPDTLAGIPHEDLTRLLNTLLLQCTVWLPGQQGISQTRRGRKLEVTEAFAVCKQWLMVNWRLLLVHHL